MKEYIFISIFVYIRIYNISLHSRRSGYRRMEIGGGGRVQGFCVRIAKTNRQGEERKRGEKERRRRQGTWGKPIGGGRDGIQAGRGTNTLPQNDNPKNHTNYVAHVFCPPGPHQTSFAPPNHFPT